MILRGKLYGLEGFIAGARGVFTNYHGAPELGSSNWGFGIDFPTYTAINGMARYFAEWSLLN